MMSVVDNVAPKRTTNPLQINVCAGSNEGKRKGVSGNEKWGGKILKEKQKYILKKNAWGKVKK